MRGMRSFLLFACILIFGGCTHHVTIRFPGVIPAERHKTWINGFLWNLIGGETDTSRFCGDRPVSRIDTKKSFGNTIVTWLTLGIYSPMFAHIWCGNYPHAAQPQPVYQAPPGYQQAPPAYQPPPG